MRSYIWLSCALTMFVTWGCGNVVVPPMPEQQVPADTSEPETDIPLSDADTGIDDFTGSDVLVDTAPEEVADADAGHPGAPRLSVRLGSGAIADGSGVTMAGSVGFPRRFIPLSD
jgi:hypothetical protein